MQGSTTVPGRSPHVRAKRERRREEILHAALRAFRERGFHATTLDAIAEHLGVRKTALYHYFPDKEAILHACHRESLAELDRIVSESQGLGEPAQRLRHLIIEHVRVMTDTLDGSPLAFEVSSLAPERQAEIIAGRDRYERELRRLIDQGIRAGDFRRVDSKVAAFAILGAINWVARWYRPEGALDADGIGAQFADQLVGGLGAKRARGARRPPARPSTSGPRAPVRRARPA
jgi:AcrR family transcriptional regulator